MSRDKDNRSFRTVLNQPSVQLETRNSGETNIENQAVSRPGYVSLKGRFRGSEHDYLEAPGAQDPLDRLAHAGIILDHEDC